MKTIAVLTDFPPEAENAAKYDLQLASIFMPTFFLYNSFLSPAEQAIAVPEVCTAENSEELQNDSVLKLALLAGRLNDKLAEKQDQKKRLKLFVPQ